MGVHERKEREREQRRQTILESAKHVFMTYGLEHASMDRIAQEAELAKGTLYLYFKSRDELIVALMVEDLEGLLIELEKVSSKRIGAEKKLVECVTAFYRFSCDNEFFYRVMTTLKSQAVFACADEGFPMHQFKAQNMRMMEIMEGIVQEGVDAGTFHVTQPVSYVVFQMMVALKGALIVFQNGMFPPDWKTGDAETLLRDIATLFARGLTAPVESARRSKKS